MSKYHLVMATPPNRSLKPAAARPAAKLPSKATASKPFLRFYHSEGRRRRTLAVLEAHEQAPQPTRYRDDLADIAVELAHAGMDYYLINPLQRANVGFLVHTTASVGVAGGLQVIGRVIRRIIGRMDQHQLVSVCGSSRELMR